METFLFYLGVAVFACLNGVLVALVLVNVLYWWPRRKFPRFQGFKEIHYRVDHYDGLYSFDVQFQMPPPERHLFGCLFIRRPKGFSLPMVRIETSLHPSDPLDGRWAASLTGVILLPSRQGYQGHSYGEVCFEHPDKHPIPTIPEEEFRALGEPVLRMIEEQLEQYMASHGHECKMRITQDQ